MLFVVCSCPVVTLISVMGPCIRLAGVTVTPPPPWAPTLAAPGVQAADPVPAASSCSPRPAVLEAPGAGVTASRVRGCRLRDQGTVAVPGLRRRTLMTSHPAPHHRHYNTSPRRRYTYLTMSSVNRKSLNIKNKAVSGKTITLLQYCTSVTLLHCFYYRLLHYYIFLLHCFYATITLLLLHFFYYTITLLLLHCYTLYITLLHSFFTLLHWFCFAIVIYVFFRRATLHI